MRQPERREVMRPHLQIPAGDVSGAARHLGPRVLIAALKDTRGSR